MSTFSLKNLVLGTAVISGIVFMTACNKNESSQNGDYDGVTRLRVTLTDDPGDFKQVWIDVKDVRINRTDQDDQNWTSLQGVKPGAYNLLDLVNGKDTILAEAAIPSGKISQIRLILGDNNYIVTRTGEKIMLDAPSAQHSGLKLNINQDVVGGIMNKLTLDFDVAKSIVKAGNSGKYILKPVIRGVLQAIGGNIKGFVLPDSVKTAVLAIRGTDTIASTYTGPGAFQIRGVDAGTYSLKFIPVDTTFRTASKDGVVVTVGQITTVDTIRLQKK